MVMRAEIFEKVKSRDRGNSCDAGRWDLRAMTLQKTVRVRVVAHRLVLGYETCPRWNGHRLWPPRCNAIQMISTRQKRALSRVYDRLRTEYWFHAKTYLVPGTGLVSVEVNSSKAHLRQVVDLSRRIDRTSTYHGLLVYVIYVSVIGPTCTPFIY